MGKVDQGEAASRGQPDGHADIITPRDRLWGGESLGEAAASCSTCGRKSALLTFQVGERDPTFTGRPRWTGSHRAPSRLYSVGLSSDPTRDV